MSEDKDFLYDDDDSVQFIKNFLPEPVKQKFSDDDISYIVDLIYDFYDSKGLLDGDDDEMVDIDIDEDELTAFVISNAISDGIGKYNAEDIALVIQGEMEYCDSIGMFE